MGYSNFYPNYVLLIGSQIHIHDAKRCLEVMNMGASFISSLGFGAVEGLSFFLTTCPAFCEVMGFMN